MIMFRGNSDPSLRKKYDRRAKAAAGFIGLVLPSVAAGFLAKRASASPEAPAAALGAKSNEAIPQAEFLALAKNNMATLALSLRHSPNVQVYPSKKASAAANRAVQELYPGWTLYKLSMPSPEIKGRFDSVDVTYDQHGRLVAENIHHNTNSPTFPSAGNPETTVGKDWGILQYDIFHSKYLPDSLLLDTTKDTGVVSRYLVGEPVDVYGPTPTTYQENPAVVSQWTAHFFNFAGAIVKYNNRKR